MNVPNELIALLKREKRFFIATHINPEGDALGSSIALSMALESMGKETLLYDRDPVPEFYRFLPGHERFSSSVSDLRSQISNLILLDCNEPERAGIDNVPIPYSAVIDHHETERDFGDIRWIEPLAPATGMMVYHLIKKLNVKITKDMATNLYAAIAIDTGTFRYSNTTPEVLRVCATLIDSGAEPASIAEAMYETWSEKRFKLLVSVLNTLEIVDGVAITYATKEMFKETGASPEDTENFSNFPRMMKSVNISAFFREMDDGYLKASLRSKGGTNVARIAEMFDGGGHRNAAGYKIKADLRTAKEELLKAISKK
ncbi:MAG: bifunctional oligoribonuclease/PAP phosphatase NrnA [Thermodesulfovibrionales bacterium]